MWCTLGGELWHTGPVRLLRLLAAYAGLLLRLFSTGLAPRTQSIYFLYWDAIVLSSSSKNNDDNGGGGDGDDGDDDGDGDGDGEETIPTSIYTNNQTPKRLHISSNDHNI